MEVKNMERLAIQSETAQEEQLIREFKAHAAIKGKSNKESLLGIISNHLSTKAAKEKK